MKAIVDTSFLVAVTNRKDIHHAECSRIVRALTGLVIVPVTVLPEACYLIEQRIGHLAMRRFLDSIISSDILVETVNKMDLARASVVLEQYADAHIDFVDTTLVALAERLSVTRILTLDQRHFRIIRPIHCEAFELLP